jgi:hypothetical protein
MPLPKYIFKKEASKVVSDIVSGEDMFIGDYEEDPDMFYLNQGSGRDAVMFTINQDNGLVEIKYSEPEKKENNDWYKTGVAENIQYYLQKHVVESATGGKKKSRRSKRKLRKNTRRNNRK